MRFETYHPFEDALVPNLLFADMCPCRCGCYISMDESDEPARVCYACRSRNRSAEERGEHTADRAEADRVRAARRPIYAPDGSLVTDPAAWERD